MVPWDERVPRFNYADATGGGRGGPLFVPTVETTRLTYFLDSLMANRWGLGPGGWGPSTGTTQQLLLNNKPASCSCFDTCTPS